MSGDKVSPTPELCWHAHPLPQFGHISLNASCQDLLSTLTLEMTTVPHSCKLQSIYIMALQETVTLPSPSDNAGGPGEERSKGTSRTWGALSSLI